MSSLKEMEYYPEKKFHWFLVSGLFTKRNSLTYEEDARCVANFHVLTFPSEREIAPAEINSKITKNLQ